MLKKPLLCRPRVAAAKLQSDLRISNCRSIATICGDYFVIGAVAVIASLLNSIAVDVLAWVVIATRQVALRNLTHSASHYALFSPKNWNDRVDWLVAYATLDSVTSYRKAHLKHHLDFSRQRTAKIAYLDDNLRLPQLNAIARTWVVFLRPFFGYAEWDYSQKRSGKNRLLQFIPSPIRDLTKQINDQPRFGLKLFLYWTTISGVAWYFGWLRELLLYWFVPLFWLFPVLNLWATISDHFAVDEGVGRNQSGLFYRWVLKPHELYHDVHHAYPHIPFYRVAGVYKELAVEGNTPMKSEGVLDFIRSVYSGVRNS
jgi:fatty acid desaturase